MDAPKNIQDFNTITGLIFDHLYQRFPEKVPLHMHEVLLEMDVEIETETRQIESQELTYTTVYTKNGVDITTFFSASISWLTEERFILRHDPEVRSINDLKPVIYTLSAMTLTALSLTPNALASEGSLGTQISDAVKDARTEAGRSAIGELVGQAIGGAIRGFGGAG